jgi:ribosomal protein S10
MNVSPESDWKTRRVQDILKSKVTAMAAASSCYTLRRDVGLEADSHFSNFEMEGHRSAIRIWTFPPDALAIQRFGRE